MAVCLIGPHPEEPWLGGCGFNTGRSILLHPQSGHCLWDPGQSHWASCRELLHIYIICVVCVCLRVFLGGGEWWGYMFSYPGLYYRFLLRFFFLCSLHFSALKVRTLASAGGPDNVVMLDPGKYKARPRVPEPAGDGSSTHPKWQVGEQEYEALMRMLDNLVRMAEVHCSKSIGEGRHRNKTHVLCFHPPLRATEQVTLTAVQHCETKLKSTVMLRLPPLMEMTVTQVLAPHWNTASSVASVTRPAG